jgi:hypothetical protein
MMGPHMTTEPLTYGQLGERLGVSAQAARALARRLRLPRQKANDGKTLVIIDMAEIEHKPKPTAVRSSGDDHAAVAALTERIAALKEALNKAEANFTAERGRCDALMAEMLKATAELMAAKQTSARLEGELAALKARRPWWKRLAG